MARTIADFAKAVFAVGLASQFFKEFGLAVRLLLIGVLILCVVTALWVQPEKEEIND